MANLFTDVNLGAGTRPFASGGRKDRGAYTGRAACLWNLYAANASQEVKLPQCSFGPLLNFVLKRPSQTGDVVSRPGVLTMPSASASSTVWTVCGPGYRLGACHLPYAQHQPKPSLLHCGAAVP